MIRYNYEKKLEKEIWKISVLQKIFTKKVLNTKVLKTKFLKFALSTINADVRVNRRQRCHVSEAEYGEINLPTEARAPHAVGLVHLVFYLTSASTNFIAHNMNNRLGRHEGENTAQGAGDAK